MPQPPDLGHRSTPTKRPSPGLDHTDRARSQARPDDPDPAPRGPHFDRRRRTSIQAAPTAVAITRTIVPAANSVPDHEPHLEATTRTTHTSTHERRCERPERSLTALARDDTQSYAAVASCSRCWQRRAAERAAPSTPNTSCRASPLAAVLRCGPYRYWLRRFKRDGNPDDLHEVMRDSSWLCPTPGHRERFLDMQERLRPARMITIVMAGVIAVTLAPRAGATLLVVGIAMVALVAIGGARLERRRRPELWIFASTVLNIQLALAAGVVLTGGPKTNLSCLLVVPVVMVAARFSNRGLVVGAPISAALIVATTLGANPGYVAAHPESIVVPLALVLCCGAYLSPLVASDVRHRADSTLDQLTGLLNRRGLGSRASRRSPSRRPWRGQPISVVAGSTSTASRPSTINTDTPWATPCCATAAYALRQDLRSFRAALPARRRGVPPAAPGRRPRRTPPGSQRRRSAPRSSSSTQVDSQSPARSGWRPRPEMPSPSARSWRMSTRRSTPPSGWAETGSSTPPRPLSSRPSARRTRLDLQVAVARASPPSRRPSACA